MNKTLTACFLLLCFCFSTILALSEIRTIRSLDEVAGIVDEFSTGTLVAIDLNDTLVYPKDALLQNWRSGWKPEGTREWTAEEDTLAWLSTPFKLVEHCAPRLINLLNEKGIYTIGFTSSAFRLDDPKILQVVPQWRLKHLKALGINFTVGTDIVFPSEEGCFPTCFEKGVLYCGTSNKYGKEIKGKVLSLYLDWLDWTPEKVVLIDDGKNHIESVRKELEKRGISFLGFLYVPKFDTIDEDVAKLQYEVMISEQHWISDQEAQALLTGT